MNPIAEEDVRIVPANEASQEERTAMLEAQTACGDPDAADTSGLVAYVDGEPAGWVAVEPRTEYPKLRTSRVPWFARERGARALEAYPMITHPGKEITHPPAEWSCESTSAPPVDSPDDGITVPEASSRVSGARGPGLQPDHGLLLA